MDLDTLQDALRAGRVLITLYRPDLQPHKWGPDGKSRQRGNP